MEKQKNQKLINKFSSQTTEKLNFTAEFKGSGEKAKQIYELWISLNPSHFKEFPSARKS